MSWGCGDQSGFIVLALPSDINKEPRACHPLYYIFCLYSWLNAGEDVYHINRVCSCIIGLCLHMHAADYYFCFTNIRELCARLL